MEQRVWLCYTSGKNTEDLKDLDHLDSVIWGANPNSKKGDLILMYRKEQYRELQMPGRFDLKTSG